jgi:hypothetical protein
MLRCRVTLGLFAAALCGSVLPASVVRAAVPTEPAKKAEVIGQPTAIAVQPAIVNLTGPRALQQLVITGQYADGTVRDLTAFADIKVEGDAAALGNEWCVLPAKNGAGTIVITAGKQTARIPYTVQLRRVPRHPQRQERLQAQPPWL